MDSDYQYRECSVMLSLLALRDRLPRRNIEIFPGYRDKIRKAKARLEMKLLRDMKKARKTSAVIIATKGSLRKT